MKRKAARVALGLLITKSPVSSCTKKSATNQVIRKKEKTTREKVKSTADKQRILSKKIVQSSVKKRVVENRKTPKTALHGRSRDRSSSISTESNSGEEEESTDEEDEDEDEEEEQPRKKFKKGTKVRFLTYHSLDQFLNSYSNCNRKCLVPMVTYMVLKL